MRISFSIVALCWLLCESSVLSAQPRPAHNLLFSTLPTRWQEGLPLGNGLSGCIVWQKGPSLRLALDRADLWDLRPMQGLARPEFNYQWVAEQVAKKEYAKVQEYFDTPYEREAGPTKLPGAALEFNLDLSGIQSASLDISTGLATVTWADGRRFESFVHAEKQEGWFRFTGFEALSQAMRLLAPTYRSEVSPTNGNSVQGSDLARLGYVQSPVFEREGVWLFHQSAWGGFSYETAVCLRQTQKGVWEGVWSITSHFPQKPDGVRAETRVKKSLRRGFERSLAQSARWWKNYWSKSSLSVPDPLVEAQYYRDLYKFGCVARENGPMISLQAVWTADNGRLPPWKGDLHHDLNTQMSYWPAYAANRLPEALSYLKHLESNEVNHRAYTARFFGTPGLNIPGVSTLLGEPMGGWIQYACSPTAAAWCAQHFYLQWRYSRDRNFLQYHSWPWLRDVAAHLEALTRPSVAGASRVLPLSSSPEIGDNSLHAWFPASWTNYDLALARFVFEKTAELADELRYSQEARKWRQIAAELPTYALEPGGALMFAPQLAYRESHRHFSHLMAIHPLGLLDWEKPGERRIIEASLHLLDSVGSAAWCGYSFAWQANLRARARDGQGALNALRAFAEAFVSKNSFHLNGDQSGKGYSSFTYDPFTLEGNFAYAAGLQEMLLQSHNDLLRIFPAVPATWANVSFQNLRAEGAFLVSARRNEGKPGVVTIRSEKGGPLRVLLPPGKWRLKNGTEVSPDGYWTGATRAGETVYFIPEQR